MKKESVYEKMTIAERKVAEFFVWDKNKRPLIWAPDFYFSFFLEHVISNLQDILYNIALHI